MKLRGSFLNLSALVHQQRVYENHNGSVFKQRVLTGHYNDCARALEFLVHFFVILYKRTWWNDQILRCIENWTTIASFFLFFFLHFYFIFIAVFQTQCRENFDSEKQSKWLQSSQESWVKSIFFKKKLSWLL